MKSFRILSVVAFLIAAFGVASAQPSGGPYGPVQQSYVVPKAAHVYYVAPDAKAGASGATLDQPTTLETAIAKVVTGDAIILRGGTYRTGNLVLSQGVTIQPYTDERPVLKGTEVASDWTANPNATWQTTWTTLFPSAPADWWRKDREEKRTPVYLFNNDMVFVDGELYAAVGTEADVKGKTYYVDYENARITLGTDPTGHVVEITAHDSALVRTMRPAHGKANDGKGPTIRGITFTQYAYRALEVEGVEPGKYMTPDHFGKEVTGTTLEHLTISFCSHVAGYFRGDNLTIRHCFVSDTGTEGVYVVNSSDVLIEKNLFTRNNIEKLTGVYASTVKIFNQTHRVTFRDNLVIDSPNSSGVWYDVGNVDGVFVNNWIERTNDGLFFEISKGVTVAGNVFVNVNKGIRILNSVGAKVYQNTFYNSVAAFERTERSANGDHFGWHASSGPDVTGRHDHIFVNNLLVAEPSFKGPLLSFWQATAVKDLLKEPHVKELDANVYVRRAGSAPAPLIQWGPVPTDKNTVDIMALDEIRKLQPAFETKSQAFLDYRGSLFQAAEIERFELMKEFPGAGVAAPLPETIREKLGWAKDAAAHPGAYAPR